MSSRTVHGGCRPLALTPPIPDSIGWSPPRPRCQSERTFAIVGLMIGWSCQETPSSPCATHLLPPPSGCDSRDRSESLLDRGTLLLAQASVHQ